MILQILLPTNINGNHWILVLVSLVDKEFIILDPLVKAHRKASLAKDIKGFMHFFIKILRASGLYDSRTLADHEWKVCFVDDKLSLPQQPDM